MRVGIHDDAEVDASLDDRSLDRRARSVPKGELDPGELTKKRGHELGQEVRAERFMATDDEAADVLFFQTPNLRFRALDQSEDVGRVTQKLLAGRSQADAASIAQKKGRSEPLLQVLHG